MSRPPPSGPATAAMPVHAVHDPIAAPRSLGAKVATMTASALGVSSAPNTPWSARAPTRTSIVGASAHSSEVTPKPPTPIENTRRSPNTSPRRPPTRISEPSDEQVGVDDPLLAGQAAAEVLLDRRQRHVDDRRVEQRHERAHDRREQAEALAGVGGDLRRGDATPRPAPLRVARAPPCGAARRRVAHRGGARHRVPHAAPAGDRAARAARRPPAYPVPGVPGLRRPRDRLRSRGSRAWIWAPTSSSSSSCRRCSTPPPSTRRRAICAARRGGSRCSRSRSSS